MPVRWNFWTGHVPEIIPTLRRSLRAYARNAGKFKVGLAKDPEHRWHHYRNEKHRWREMVVIYRTTSPDKAREAESLLIEHGRTRYPRKSQNKKRDGGGRRPGIADGHDYYVYVVLA